MNALSSLCVYVCAGSWVGIVCVSWKIVHDLHQSQTDPIIAVVLLQAYQIVTLASVLLLTLSGMKSIQI